jgi:hypothetical protein
MHPFGSYLATKPHLEGPSGSRQAEIDAMYRRPDCAPLPAVPPRPSLIRRLVDALPPLGRRHPRHV